MCLEMDMKFKKIHSPVHINSLKESVLSYFHIFLPWYLRIVVFFLNFGSVVLVFPVVLA